jgi:hypothetical protein
MSRLHASTNSELRSRLGLWANLSLGEKAGAIAAKLSALRIVAHRLDCAIVTVQKELLENTLEVEACIKAGAAYTPRSKDLAYELLIDSDSFLFETRSAYELTAGFVGAFLSAILGKAAQTKAQLHKVLSQEISFRNGDTSWIDELRNHRNLFVHETAPWPALEILSLVPLKAELVLLKRNVNDLSDPSTYLHMKQCRAIYSGFWATFPILETWLLGEVEKFEARHTRPG